MGSPAIGPQNGANKDQPASGVNGQFSKPGSGPFPGGTEGADTGTGAHGALVGSRLPALKNVPVQRAPVPANPENPTLKKQTSKS